MRLTVFSIASHRPSTANYAVAHIVDNVIEYQVLRDVWRIEERWSAAARRDSARGAMGGPCLSTEPSL